MGASLVGDLIVWLAWALAGGALLSVVATLVGRWELGRRAARMVVLGTLAYPFVAVALIVAVARPDASSKATALGRTISAAMNGAPAGVAAALVWIVAARRKRRQRTD